MYERYSLPSRDPPSSSLLGTLHTMNDQHISPLEQERIKAISSLASVDHIYVAGLVERHNAIVNQQLAVERQIIASNIEKLPDELVLECFKQVFEQDPHSIYPFLFLSQSWQTILLSTPLIWCSILLENDDTDQLQKLHMSLYLSQDLPLDLILRFSSDDQTKGLALDVISANRHRIRSIELQSNQTGAALVSQARLIQTLAEMGPMPNLKTISWNPTPGVILNVEPIITVPPEQLVCYPSLERLVNLMIFDKEVHLIPSPRRITEISLIITAQGWQPYIYTMLPNLQSIRFWFQLGRFSLPSKKDDGNLRNCRIETVICRTLEDTPGQLPILRLSSIRTLEISFSPQSLSQFMGGGFDLPPIRRLSLAIIWKAGSNIFDPPVVLPDLSTVNDFQLTIDGPLRHTDNGMQESATAFSDIMAMFSDNLRYCQNFTFCSSINLPHGPLFHFLDQCVRLISLGIACSTTPLPGDVPIIVLPTVELLSMDPLWILCHLNAPNCRSIKIYGQESSSSFAFKGGLQLSSMTLAVVHVGLLAKLNTSGLQHLLWTPVHWNSLSASKDGELWGIYGVSPDPRAFAKATLAIGTLQSISFAITVDQAQQHNIVLEMIKSPDTLPYLHTIAFAQFPSLILLIQLLVSRNIQTPSSTHNSSISDVKLPSYPSKKVLVPLSKLLARHLPSQEEFEVEMPEEDLSLFDESITGCNYCFDSGHFCQEPMAWTSKSSSQKLDSLGTVRQSLRPNYPVMDSKLSAGEWIMDWTQSWSRRESMRDARGGFVRQNYCSRHHPFDLVSITGKLGPLQLLE